MTRPAAAAAMADYILATRHDASVKALYDGFGALVAGMKPTNGDVAIALAMLVEDLDRQAPGGHPGLMSAAVQVLEQRMRDRRPGQALREVRPQGHG